MRLLIPAALALVALGVTGCGPITPQTTSRLATAQYTCAKFPFSPPVLDERGVDEGMDDPRAVALNAFLDQEGAIEEVPDAGWHLVGSDETSAEFVTKAPNGYWTVNLENAGAAWSVVGWGGCNPELAMVPGVRVATWTLAPDAPVPGATSTSITVHVYERSCSSGQPAAGRIVGPEVAYEEEEILIAFGVTKLPGAQECPGADPTQVTVELTEPIGTRVISDVGVWPPTNQLAN